MKRTLIAVLVVSTWLVPTGSASSARVTAKGETFSALAILPCGGVRGAGSTVNITVYISGYTSDTEAHQYASLLADSGPDALLKAIGKADTLGRVSTTGHVGQFQLKI